MPAIIAHRGASLEAPENTIRAFERAIGIGVDRIELDAVALELADIQLYLVRLADRLGVDLVAAAHRKIGLNAEKYPADRSRGHARKYDQL